MGTVILQLAVYQFFRFETKKIFTFLAQGADGSWGRGLHGCAVLQEGEEGRRYVHIATTVLYFARSRW